MATKKPDVQQFILLPIRGLRAEGRTASDEARNFLLDTHAKFKAARSNKSVTVAAAGFNITSSAMSGGKMRVLDSITENGAKLVELSPQQALSLRVSQPGLKIIPLVYYYPQRLRREIEAKVAAASSTKLRLSIVSKGPDGKPIAGAKVVAFTDFANRIGASGTTNNQGIVDLALGTMKKQLERLYIYPARNFWTFFQKNNRNRIGF